MVEFDLLMTSPIFLLLDSEPVSQPAIQSVQSQSVSPESLSQSVGQPVSQPSSQPVSQSRHVRAKSAWPGN